MTHTTSRCFDEIIYAVLKHSDKDSIKGEANYETQDRPFAHLEFTAGGIRYEIILRPTTQV